jgi:hypothetical protein
MKYKLVHKNLEGNEKLFRRVTTVRMPNGKYRYPVDYYDATPGAVAVTPQERERIRIPVYQMLI